MTCNDARSREHDAPKVRSANAASWNPDRSRLLATGAIQSDAAHLARKFFGSNFFGGLGGFLAAKPEASGKQFDDDYRQNNEIRRETDRKDCREAHDLRLSLLYKDQNGILVSSEKGNCYSDNVAATKFALDRLYKHK